jgi:hypothetical protein
LVASVLVLHPGDLAPLLRALAQCVVVAAGLQFTHAGGGAAVLLPATPPLLGQLLLALGLRAVVVALLLLVAPLLEQGLARVVPSTLVLRGGLLALGLLLRVALAHSAQLVAALLVAQFGLLAHLFGLLPRLGALSVLVVLLLLALFPLDADGVLALRIALPGLLALLFGALLRLGTPLVLAIVLLLFGTLLLGTLPGLRALVIALRALLLRLVAGVFLLLARLFDALAHHRATALGFVLGPQRRHAGQQHRGADRHRQYAWDEGVEAVHRHVPRWCTGLVEGVHLLQAPMNPG